jgi:hypothetical protein
MFLFRDFDGYVFTVKNVYYTGNSNYIVGSCWNLIYLTLAIGINWSRVSSVSIVSDYGLGDRGSIPGRGKGFFL